MAVPKVIFDRRLGLAILAVAIYLALFVIMVYTPGKGMAIATIIPVVVIAWVYGFQAGVWAGVLSAPVNIFLCMLMGLDWVEKFYVGGVGIAGTLIEVLIGAVVGKLHDYYKRLQDELGVRKVLEAELQQHRTRLEEMVQAKTAELEASNQQLRASQSDMSRARDFMENTFHCAIDGFLVIDNKGSILIANRSIEQMLGYDQGELVGMCITEVAYEKEGYLERALKMLEELKASRFVEHFKPSSNAGMGAAVLLN